MEQKTFEIINCSNAKYTYNDNERKLMAIKPHETVFDIDSGTVGQTFIMGGNETPVTLTAESKFYTSEESFKLCVPLYLEQATRKNTLKDIMGVLFCYVYEDEVGPFVWSYANGNAYKWRIEEHAKTVRINHVDSGKTTMDCEKPESYRNSEEVFMYNDYTVQHNDGTKEVHEGVYKRLFLTNEQNALLDKLQAVIDECKEAGIALDFNYANYGLMAFNTKNIKEYGYDPEYDEEKEAAYCLDLSRAGRYMRHIGDINTDDDCVQFVIEKPCKD